MISTIAHLASISNNLITLDQLSSSAMEDEQYCKLVSTISKGFTPARQLLEPLLHEYWEIRDHLSTNNGIAYLDDRTIIPLQLRKQVLECLHSAHSGISGMRSRVNVTIYWPGMSAGITNTHLTCC